MKRYKIKVSYVFDAIFEVNADSTDEAVAKIKDNVNCGSVVLEYDTNVIEKSNISNYKAKEFDNVLIEVQEAKNG